MKITKKIRGKVRAFTSALMAYLFAAFMTVSASAVDAEIKPQQYAKFSGVTKWIQSMTSEFKTIGYAVAGLSVVILGIIFATAGQEGLGKGKRMAVGIIVGICVISFGTSIVTDLKG